MPLKNSNLHQARKNKNDEFYTRKQDIRKELKHYQPYFHNQTVYLNCDDPKQSQFYIYFKEKFKQWELKKLIATHYAPSDLFHQDVKAYKNIVNKVEEEGRFTSIFSTFKVLQGDGDFRSQECVQLLKSADIIVTNPPFSLLGEYIELLMKHQKKFLIVASKNALIHKSIFKYLATNQIWTGHHLVNEFLAPGGKTVSSPALWLTNLGKSQKPWLKSTALYDPLAYPRFDHIDAINVDKVTDIPKDYEGVMGVPITFLLYYNPQQFEIVDAVVRYSVLNGPTLDTQGKFLASVNEKWKYSRVLIKRRKI